jgi:predicted phosphodiesterase
VRTAVISDIHASADALAAVLEALAGERVTSIVSLGDVVGYNAFPRETIALLRQAGIGGVVGNHDLMALGRIPLDRCGPRARRVVEWTAAQLTSEDRAFLEGLGQEIHAGELLFVHSMLGDPVTRLRHAAQFRVQHEAIARRYPEVRICFTGHTHQPHAAWIDAAGELHSASASVVHLGPRDFWFINPGTVGEPRGTDQRAAFAIYDSAQLVVEFRQVRYDRTRTLQENRRHQLAAVPEPQVHSITSRMRRLVRRAASLVASRIA